MTLLIQKPEKRTTRLKAAINTHGSLRRLLAGFLLFSAFSAQVTAQEGQPQARHYSVEMIIFSREEPEQPYSEQWPEETQITLPDAYLKLHKASDITASLLKKTQPDVASRVKTNAAGETEVVEVPVGALPLDQQQRADISNNRLPHLFYLPASKMQLRSQKNRIERRKAFRILFHQAWNMPVYAKEHSTPILIQGGERYDNLFELEGSITLSVARYLHLDSELYLRTFEVNQSNKQNHEPGFSKLLNTQTGTAAASQTNNPATANADTAPDPSLALLGFRQYRVVNAIPLKQSRRMRSGDLHYIDHPRYGILI